MTRILHTIHRLEITLVSFFMASARNPASHGLARLFSKLGNLWIYPLVALGLIALDPKYGTIVIAIALGNVGILQFIYGPLKRRIMRRRPFQIHMKFRSALPVLDEYSFPSGHIMTLTGVVMPIMLVFPALVKLCLVVWIMMAWARIATGHHFVTDVIGGALIGLCVSYPVSTLAIYEIHRLSL